MKPKVILFIFLLTPFYLLSQVKSVVHERFYALDEPVFAAEYNEGSHFFGKLPNKYLMPKSVAPYIHSVYPFRFNTFIYDVIEDSGFYYLTGHIHNQTNLFFDSINNTLLFRAKIDSMGGIEWYYEDSLANGDHYMTYQHCVIMLKNNTMLSMGYLDIDYQHITDYEIRLPVYINYDKDGTVIFSKLIADTVGRKLGFWPIDVIAEEDSGFTVAGFVGSQSRTWHVQDQFWYHDTTYVTVIRYDKCGNEMHRAMHYVGGEPRSPVVSVLLKTPDGKYVVSGNKVIINPPTLGRKNYVLCLDSAFNFLWKKTFGQSMQTTLNQVNLIKLSDNGYAFTTNHIDTPCIQSPMQTDYTMYYRIGLMDSLFNITKDTIFLTKSLYNPSEMSAGSIVEIEEASNGDLVVGVRGAYGVLLFWMNRDLYLYRERFLWLYEYTRPCLYLLNMRLAADDGVMLVGYLYGGGWFVRTDSLGFSLPNQGDTLMHLSIETHDNSLSKTELIVWPVPAMEYLTIQTKDKTPLPQGKLQVFSMYGKKVTEIEMHGNSAELQFSVSDLPTGLYVGRVAGAKGESANFKFLRK